ncbi:glycoside hydrolase family 105 protein [Paenibacillus sepulcri]|uniref:Glycoside hydrolase family 88 protein n=1 Tax=Paenibacillus sepulcri TaxID=359917 RepID=A0ABS7BW73_9BACL|nr:glycoside hydrolase family 88 protein [Paenibacillus sepulcri]
MINQAEHGRRIQRTPLEWAEAACNSLMNRYSPMQLPPANRWHYHQGVFLCGMLQLWQKNHDQRYLLYVKTYADLLIDEYGNFYFQRDELDAIQAGLILFTLDEQFGEARYRLAAAKLRQLFHTFNLTSEGGFWHKDKYPYQMWLDGLYMGGVFAVKYARHYNASELVDQTLKQEKLMRTHMQDPRTGLYYHAWDERRLMPWADPETGCSPEFWGRSVGWYAIAIVDLMDDLPAGHPATAGLTGHIRNLLYSLIRYQDKASGMWYQVIDKGSRPDNWLESSCTSLFVYAIAKAIKHGYVDDDCRSAAIAGYEGLIHSLYEDEQGLVMPGICVGTSAGDYTHYVTRETSGNDLHGVGALIMACCEMDGLVQA